MNSVMCNYFQVLLDRFHSHFKKVEYLSIRASVVAPPTPQAGKPVGNTWLRPGTSQMLGAVAGFGFSVLATATGCGNHISPGAESPRWAQRTAEHPSRRAGPRRGSTAWSA